MFGAMLSVLTNVGEVEFVLQLPAGSLAIAVILNSPFD